jgi:hypothetical protein
VVEHEGALESVDRLPALHERDHRGQHQRIQGVMPGRHLLDHPVVLRDRQQIGPQVRRFAVERLGITEELFTEAMAGSSAPVVLPDGPVEELPAGHEDTKDRLRQLVCEGYLDVLSQLADGNEDKDLRTELFGAWLLGVGILRTAVGTPTLAKASEEDLRPHLAAVAEALFGRPVTP